MKPMTNMLSVAISVIMLTVPAEAKNHKQKVKGNSQGIAAQKCPPGLAKKNPPCIPPGQAKKQSYDQDRLRVGDIIRGDYIVISDPRRYGLERDKSYYRAGDYLYQVDESTRKVLVFLGAANDLLN